MGWPAVWRMRIPLLCLAIGATLVHAQPPQTCPDGNAGLTLPPGFCARIFADTVGVARHITVADNGDVFISLGSAEPGAVTQIGNLRPDRRGGAVLILRDTDRDGRADREAVVPMETTSTGIALRDNVLYVAVLNAIVRFRVDSDRFGILGTPDTIVAGFPTGGHTAKSLALDGAGNLFVSVGSASNACRSNRNETAPDPCPELVSRAGIWRYDANRTGQQHPRDGERWATGVRNGLGLYWHAGLRALFGTSHGRDALNTLFPSLYTVEQNADTPSEEFFRLDRGADLGWPYCFHDRRRNAKVMAPEYGGDGTTVGRCAGKTMPLAGFPGHWGPNALMFYTGTMFPAKYRDGVFVAFHGSWNRMPLDEDGYNVVFQPMRAGAPSGAFEIFGEGFAEGDKEPMRASHRPSGLAQASDGSLFITDDQRGRVYRVLYVGTRR
jgi:glucose/arabinose dehydrogenase